jgi:benzaldehyde dehydrogenase (NAD)
VVSDPLIDMVSFTGSTRAGKQVGAMAGEMFKRVSLELGGNNPYIVLPGVDIDAAASAGAWGSFFHQGQICLTAGRHLVHESIVEEYTQALVKHAANLSVGDPTGQVHLGPIINERQAANVDRIVAETVEAGAQVLVGGGREGLFYEPTVITGVRPGMACFEEEIFGPVAPIVTFGSDEEAIALANSTKYGLSAATCRPRPCPYAADRRGDPRRHCAHQRPAGAARGLRPDRRRGRIRQRVQLQHPHERRPVH